MNTLNSSNLRTSNKITELSISNSIFFKCKKVASFEIIRNIIWKERLFYIIFLQEEIWTQLEYLFISIYPIQSDRYWDGRNVCHISNSNSKLCRRRWGYADGVLGFKDILYARCLKRIKLWMLTNLVIFCRISGMYFETNVPP